MAVPSSLVIFLSCINVTLYNFWARIKIVVVKIVVVVVTNFFGPFLQKGKEKPSLNWVSQLVHRNGFKNDKIKTTKFH